MDDLNQPTAEGFQGWDGTRIWSVLFFSLWTLTARAGERIPFSCKMFPVGNNPAVSNAIGTELHERLNTEVVGLSQSLQTVDCLPKILERTLELPKGIAVEILKMFNVLSQKVYRYEIASFMFFHTEQRVANTFAAGPMRVRTFSEEEVEVVLFNLSACFRWASRAIERNTPDELERLIGDSPEVLREQDRNGNTLMHIAIAKLGILMPGGASFLHFILNKPEVKQFLPTDVVNRQNDLPVHLMARQLLALEPSDESGPQARLLAENDYCQAVTLAKKIRSIGFPLNGWPRLLEVLASSKDGRSISFLFCPEREQKLEKNLIPDDFFLFPELLQRLRENPLWRELVQDYEARRKNKLVRLEQVLYEISHAQNAYEIDLILEKNRALVETERNSRGDTMLVTAIMSNHLTLFKALLGVNASVKVADGLGFSLLYLAVVYANPEMVDLLIAAGVKLEDEKDDCSALDMAIIMGSTALVDVFVRAGAIKNSGRKTTPLHLAATNNFPSYKGPELIHGAQIASMLIKAGADVHALNRNGESALHVAAQTRSVKIVKVLIENGADVNTIDKKGNSPLHYAVDKTACNRVERYYKHTRSNWAVVCELLAAQARIDIRNAEGKTPMDIAQGPGYYRLLLTCRWKQLFQAKR
jgi:ankyrin repeat protein